MPFNPYGAESAGTTIVAMLYNNGLVMSADTFTTSSFRVANRFANKIKKIHDRIYCTGAGEASAIEACKDYLRYFTE